MLRLSRFEYIPAQSARHATELLQEHGADAMIMAGGTDLLVNIKHRVTTPHYVIGIRHLSELHALQDGVDGWLTIGAGVTLASVESHPLVRTRYPALATAAHLVSSPQVRTVGTLGGNVCLDARCNYYNQSQEWRKAIGFCMKKDSAICRVAPGGDRCWAVASADTVPVLIALRAEIKILGGAGTRRVPLEQLYVDDGLTPLTLAFGELVTAVHIPPPQGYACDYQKFRIRQSFDFPLVGVAVAIERSVEGVVADARIVMTAVASFPERALEAERVLIGSELHADAISAAGEAVFKRAKPMDNTAGSIFHRKRMARVLAERSLRRIAGVDEARAG